MVKSTSKMIVALGSNQRSVAGGPDSTILGAARALQAHGALIRKRSQLYQTPCFPAGAGPDYVNAALLIEAHWSPAEALAHLHDIEHEFGRERIKRWGQRTLDLDLIAMDDVVAPDLPTYEVWRDLEPELQTTRAPTELILPHPRLQDRAFVLVPMADVASDWVHPVSGLSVSQMLAVIPAHEKAEVIPLNQ